MTLVLASWHPINTLFQSETLKLTLIIWRSSQSVSTHQVSAWSALSKVFKNVRCRAMVVHMKWRLLQEGLVGYIYVAAGTWTHQQDRRDQGMVQSCCCFLFYFNKLLFLNWFTTQNIPLDFLMTVVVITFFIHHILGSMLSQSGRVQLN